MLPVSDHNITKFLDICHNENGFVFPAVYSCCVSCAVTKDMINKILRINAIRTVNVFEIAKCFVEFLFRFKTAVCSILGGGFNVQVFHSFNHMEDWSYIESATIVCDRCEEFLIHQPVTHSCTTLKIESKNEFGENLWNKIRDGLQKNHKKILETSAAFDCVNLPKHENNTNIHIDCNFSAIYFLR